MGPDEQPSREELGLIVRFMFAKFQQQTDFIGILSELLIAKGVLSDQELEAMAVRLEKSPSSVKSKKALEDLREFAKIHSTARQYLDRLEE